MHSREMEAAGAAVDFASSALAHQHNEHGACCLLVWVLPGMRLIPAHSA